MNWSASTNQNWCHVSPASGSVAAGGRANISVSVDAPSNVGTFACNISISDPNATNSPQNVSVTYRVGSPSTGNPSNVIAVASGCNSIIISWSGGSNVTSYNLFRSINNSIPSAPYDFALSKTSYIDVVVSPGSNYYYWVQSVGGIGTKVAANTNSLGGAALQDCAVTSTSTPPTVSGQPNLSASDKNLRAINDAVQPNTDCDTNQFQGLPSQSSIMEEDILTFEINLCNLSGTADASNVIVTDSLINFEQPVNGWEAKIDGSSLQFVYTNFQQGQYVYDSASKKLIFNVGTIPQGTVKQIVYRARIKTQTTSTTACTRCESKTVIMYNRPGFNAAEMIELSTPGIFYKKSP